MTSIKLEVIVVSQTRIWWAPRWNILCIHKIFDLGAHEHMRQRLLEIGSQRKGPWEHLVGKRRLKLGNKSPSKGRATRLAQPGIGTLRKCEVHNNEKPGQLVNFCVEFVFHDMNFIARHKGLFTSTVRLTIWKKKQGLKQKRKKKSNKQKCVQITTSRGKYVCVGWLVYQSTGWQDLGVFWRMQKNPQNVVRCVCYFATNTSSTALP